VDLGGTSAPAELLGLILACKQIHSEAELLFYSGNTFRIHYGWQLEQWLQKRTEPQCNAITTVMLEFDVFLKHNAGQGT
jgi:hypothetical protein